MNTLILIILATIKMFYPIVLETIIALFIHGVIYQVTGFSIYNEIEKKLIKF